MPAPRLLADAAQLSSLADETPEGRSIVVLAKEKYGLRGRDVTEIGAHFIPFSAETRMSGCDLDGRKIRKGAVDAIAAYVEEMGGTVGSQVEGITHGISDTGGTPLVVAEGNKVLGVIHLKDVVKGGISERFERFRAMGIRTVMITGDNPRTAAAIAREAGVDDFLAQATPETKMRLIKEEQAKGKLVAMTGDGTNDAPALAQADVGVAMNTGHAGGQGSRQHGRSGFQSDQAFGSRRDRQADADDPRRVDDVFHRQRRGQSISRSFPRCSWASIRRSRRLNIMHLASPQSAILSAVIFNAIIIILLIPLALRGVQYRPIGAGPVAGALTAHLRRRRSHRAIRRHQAGRYGFGSRRAGLGDAEEKQFNNVQIVQTDLRILAGSKHENNDHCYTNHNCHVVVTGLIYPFVMTGLAQVLISLAGQRQSGDR